MEIKILNDIYSDENTYFLIENGKAIVIDPGNTLEKTEEFSKGLDIEYIFLTHCHYDHITCVNELREKYNAKVCCTKECAENIKNPNVSLTLMGLGKRIVIEKADIILDEKTDFDFYGNKIKTIKTPGHTSCSTVFLAGENLFSGDTIFYQNVGRWDLPTGDGEILANSIREKIYTLPENTKIYPGHGKSTSVEYEKKYNMYV